MWNFIGNSLDGEKFLIDEVNVWDYEWIDTKQTVQVKDPIYGKEFDFNIWGIESEGKALCFVAGEFSNGVWGFYLER